MDGERDFKARPEHWVVMLNFLEVNTNLLHNKFNNGDGDALQQKQKWQDLTNQLNSLGFGQKTAVKWQAALGRWKSKVKAKAAALRASHNKTGGGPSKLAPLSEQEERLMGLLGWRAVTGDGGKERVLENIAPQEESNKAAIINTPSTSQGGTCTRSPPPLTVYNHERETAGATQAQKFSEVNIIRKRKSATPKMILLKS